MLPDRIPRGWGYPPPRPPVVSGLAVLVLVTVSFALVAPHARTIGASLAAGKLPAINLPGPLPGSPCPTSPPGP